MLSRFSISVNNAEFLPAVISFIEEGHTATISLRGVSMRPFLEDGRDKALLGKPSDIKVGDAVLAEISPSRYVLHRVWKIKGENVTLLGDGNLTPEHCHLSDIRAKALGFYRKKRDNFDSVDSYKWKVYSFIWTRLFPIRRYLLFIHRRLI